MRQLEGTIFPTGAIEFLFSKNKWAYEWYSAAAKGKAFQPRVVIEPKKVGLVMEPSPAVAEEGIPWVESVTQLINTADTVLLNVMKNCFRFQRATHEIKPTLELVTLGTHTDITEYAEESWSKIKYFYARRHDDVTFDLKKIYSHREGAEETKAIELTTRVRNNADSETGFHVSFLASGSGTPIEFIDWRKEVEHGETGRFAIEGTHLNVKVVHAKRPITFLHERREEFRNHSYEFEGDQIAKQLARIATLA